MTRARNPANESKGIPCRKCGYHIHKVKDTALKNGHIIRTRICRRCGHRFRSTETPGVTPHKTL